MSKKVEDTRKQPEFLFVFNSTSRDVNRQMHVENERSATVSLSEDVVRTHREKLLAELRQFGC